MCDEASTSYFLLETDPLFDSVRGDPSKPSFPPGPSPDGSKIYYRSSSRLMAARIDTASGVRVLSRRVAFEPFTLPLYDDYAIHPNGRTLAVVRPVGDARGREITWVLNWQEELQRRIRQCGEYHPWTNRPNPFGCDEPAFAVLARRRQVREPSGHVHTDRAGFIDRYGCGV